MYNAKMVAPIAVKYKEFKLATQAGRIGLLCGITAGTVTRAEVEAAVLQDTEKRPFRKPVVAAGKRYNSVTEAAAAMCRKNATLNELKGEQARIRRLCNQDCWEGYYWSE